MEGQARRGSAGESPDLHADEREADQSDEQLEAAVGEFRRRALERGEGEGGGGDPDDGAEDHRPEQGPVVVLEIVQIAEDVGENERGQHDAEHAIGVADAQGHERDGKQADAAAEAALGDADDDHAGPDKQVVGDRRDVVGDVGDQRVEHAATGGYSELDAPAGDVGVSRLRRSWAAFICSAVGLLPVRIMSMKQSKR